MRGESLPVAIARIKSKPVRTSRRDDAAFWISVLRISFIPQMRYEVEQKHRVDDARGLVARLDARGVRLEPAIVQVDQYFAHPCRDFAQTDEALRIRTAGDCSIVTYKGPKIDATTKTRRELELTLAADDPDGARLADLLRSLGFTPAMIVRKQRRTFRIVWQGRQIEGALDEVDDVGMYLELELVVDDADLAAARQAIAELSDELRLGSTERRSYLELLLEKRSGE
jgi:adenylate cyclase class 2